MMDDLYEKFDPCDIELMIHCMRYCRDNKDVLQKKSSFLNDTSKINTLIYHYQKEYDEYDALAARYCGTIHAPTRPIIVKKIKLLHQDVGNIRDCVLLVMLSRIERPPNGFIESILALFKEKYYLDWLEDTKNNYEFYIPRVEKLLYKLNELDDQLFFRELSEKINQQ